MRKFSCLAGMLLTIWLSSNAQTFSLVKDIRSGTLSSVPSILRAINNNVLFLTVNGATFDLWKSNGTEAGTIKLRTLSPSSPFPATFLPVRINNTVFFFSWSLEYGYELWKTDGTVGGTVIVKDINPNSGSEPQNLCAVNNTLFFSAHDGGTGFELWKSDGTESGTIRVKDINPGAVSSEPQNLVNINGMLYFTANNGTDGAELWKSDGTEAGTILIKDVTTGSGSSTIHSMIMMSNHLFFSANNQLWESDGTEAGTTMIKNISLNSATNIIQINGVLFFNADDGSGMKLWKSDGTSVGTVSISAVSARNLIDMNGALYFRGNDGIFGDELWKSDGTAVGTALVKDTRTGSSSGVNSSIFKVGNMLMFGANDGINGSEIWRSDGTEGGTNMLQDIMPGSSNSNPTEFLEVNGKIYTGVTSPGIGKELWVAAISMPGPLPVTLTSLAGRLSGSDALLSWNTSSEQNTSHFEIERSTDGRNFAKTGIVNASGNSSTEKQYGYTDRNILSLHMPIVYYRLKVKDIDSKFTYSKIIAINISSSEAVLMFYPNPASENATLMIAARKKENITYSIIDMHGRTVQQKSITINEGSNMITIETAALAAGTYTIVLKGPSTYTNMKFMKQ